MFDIYTLLKVSWHIGSNFQWELYMKFTVCLTFMCFVSKLFLIGLHWVIQLVIELSQYTKVVNLISNQSIYENQPRNAWNKWNNKSVFLSRSLSIHLSLKSIFFKDKVTSYCPSLPLLVHLILNVIIPSNHNMQSVMLFFF